MKNEQKEWYQVDNVANMFLSSLNERNTRTLRISCTLYERIDQELLQKAADETIVLWRTYQVQIKKGYFWHYIEATDASPVVTEESKRLCPLLYYPESGETLHYQITWYDKRINLDIFHAIADGLGAVSFLNSLVYKYLKLKNKDFKGGESPYDRVNDAAMSEDSYLKYYKRPAKYKRLKNKAFHPESRLLPHKQLQFFELHLPLDEVLREAKSLSVTLTSYLGAKLIMAFLKEMPESERKKPVTVSMPINLRNFYPSVSARNFFQNVTISHEYTGGETLESLSLEYNRRLKDILDPENIDALMDSYTKYQKKLPLRLAPLVFKKPFLRHMAKKNDNRVSCILSNLGSIKVPEEMTPFIDYYGAYCSSTNLFFTICSFKNTLVISVSSPYKDTGVLKNFVRSFSHDGIPVRLYATEVAE